MTDVPLSAQISTLRHFIERGSPPNMKRGMFANSTSEAELLRTRLRAALETLEREVG